MEVTESDGLAACSVEIVEAGGRQIFLHLRQAGLEAGVEAGELAAGRGARLRHLGEIGQGVDRAVEREEFLVVLLVLASVVAPARQRHLGGIEEIGGGEDLGVLRGVVRCWACSRADCRWRWRWFLLAGGELRAAATLAAAKRSGLAPAGPGRIPADEESNGRRCCHADHVRTAAVKARSLMNTAAKPRQNVLNAALTAARATGWAHERRLYAARPEAVVRRDGMRKPSPSSKQALAADPDDHQGAVCPGQHRQPAGPGAAGRAVFPPGAGAGAGPHRSHGQSGQSAARRTASSMPPSPCWSRPWRANPASRRTAPDPGLGLARKGRCRRRDRALPRRAGARSRLCPGPGQSGRHAGRCRRPRRGPNTVRPRDQVPIPATPRPG